MLHNNFKSIEKWNENIFKKMINQIFKNKQDESEEFINYIDKWICLNWKFIRDKDLNLDELDRNMIKTIEFRNKKYYIWQSEEYNFIKELFQSWFEFKNIWDVVDEKIDFSYIKGINILKNDKNEIIIWKNNNVFYFIDNEQIWIKS